MKIEPLYKKMQLCTFTKYIAALLVVNGHLFIFGNTESIFNPYMNLGACCVALFYFFSGYGLIYSYNTKGTAYLTGFFHKRFIKILLPLVTAYMVTLPIYAIFKGPVNISTFITTLYWGGPYLKFSWFVSEILVVYLMFYGTMKIPSLSITCKLVILSVSIIALMAVLFAFNMPIWYIVSLPGFLVGIWYCKFEKRTVVMSLPQVLTLLFGFGIMWAITWQWKGIFGAIIPQFRYEFIAMFVSPTAFTCFVIILLSAISITPPHLRITSSSYELYLMQSGVMIIAQSYTDSFVTYWLTTMALAIIIASAIHKANDIIIRIIQSGLKHRQAIIN